MVVIFILNNNNNNNNNKIIKIKDKEILIISMKQISNDLISNYVQCLYKSVIE